MSTQNNPSLNTSNELLNQIAINQKRLEDLQTGGDSYCYVMFYNFDLKESIARDFVVTRKGEFPLYDLRFRIVDMETSKTIFERPWGEHNSPADFLLVKWKLAAETYYRIFFNARNGAWHQDLILRKSVKANCWLAATRVMARNGFDVSLEEKDNEYEAEFGSPTWRE